MKLGPTTRTPPSACPQCGAVNDAADRVEPDESGNSPTPGDVSVCMYCGAVALFDEELKLRAPTAEEMVAIRADAEAWPIIQLTQRSIHGALSSRRAAQQ